MSTSKPRITITLEPRVYDIVSRLSKAGGESMSQIVTGFLEVAVPPMERMVVLMEQANAAPEEAKAGLASSLARAEARILPSLLNAIDQSDMFVAEEAKKLLGGEQRRPARSVGRAAQKPLTTPVPVTRGSGPSKAAKRGGKHGGL
jgi:hypothetical protein